MRTRYTVASRKRRKKVLKRAKGFHGARSLRIKTAREAVMHALMHAYNDRRRKKRDYRALWITRINALVRSHDMTYSRFIEGLTKANIAVNRKLLSNLAIEDPAAFMKYIEIAKGSVAVKKI
jgi:large subunit ribosomal protein L20